MSKTSRELIEFCKGKLGTPYVFGMKGQVLTEALLKQLAAENPKVSYRSGYNGTVLKTVVRQRTVGSNPTLSAT